MMGGYGYSSEYDMERLVRTSLVSTIYGGTSEIQRNIIAKTLGPLTARQAAAPTGAVHQRRPRRCGSPGRSRLRARGQRQRLGVLDPLGHRLQAEVRATETID